MNRPASPGLEDGLASKPAEKAVTLMEYLVLASWSKKAFRQNILIVALMATVFGGFVVGCGTEAPKQTSDPAAQAKPAEPAIPEDIQDVAKHLLGSDAQVLLLGDLAKNGKRQFLAANVVPKTPKNNIPGTVVTRAIVAQDDEGKWTELLRVDEHLKNQKGYLGLTPLDSINGWRLQYEQNAEKGLQLYFTPLKVNGDTHVLPVGVRWNPATQRYQSLDASYEHFLKESTSLQNMRSTLR
jgi:hypothetical protein